MSCGGNCKCKAKTETIEISVAEYQELLSDQKMLIALQGAGVDNWDGYEEALEMLETMQ